MRKTFLGLFIVLLASQISYAEDPIACEECWIGIFADTLATTSVLGIQPWHEPVEAYFIAHVPSDFQALQAVFFRVENWIGDVIYPTGSVEVEWKNIVMEDGNLETGKLLACTYENQWYVNDQGNVIFGTIRITSYDPDWPGDGIELTIKEYLGEFEKPAIMNYPELDTYYVDGLSFTLFSIPPTSTRSTNFKVLKMSY